MDQIMNCLKSSQFREMVKRGLVICGLAMVAWTSVGCNKSTPPPPTGREGQGGGLVGDRSINLGTGVGAVFSTNDADFNAQIKNFVSSTMNPNEFGHVASSLSEQERTQTGIRFYGAVGITSNGYVDPNNAYMVLYIWDDLAGKSAADDSKIPPYIANLPRLMDVQVDSSRARLQFESDYSRIIMDGTYMSGTYEGTMSYETFVTAGSGGIKRGTFGTFRIRTCEFFLCSGTR